MRNYEKPPQLEVKAKALLAEAPTEGLPPEEARVDLGPGQLIGFREELRCRRCRAQM